MGDYVAAARRAVFHVDSRSFVLTSLQCLCGPVCFCDCSCLHCVRAVIESRVLGLNISTLEFSCSAPPPSSRGGSLELLPG